MTVERSGRGVLTTNADYYQPYEDNQINWISTPSQWTQYDNMTIIRRFSTQSFISGATGQIGYYSVPRVVLSCESNLNYDLEYSIIVFNYRSEKFFESAWYDNNDFINCTLTDFRWNGYSEPQNTNNITWIWEVWVRRKDGGALSRQDMLPCSFAINRYFEQRIYQTTALPQNWFDTTTASFQSPMDTYTTIIPTDYDISSSQFDPLLEIPSKIDTAINFVILGFGRIMNFRYISFVVCFVLIVGLVAWLIH